MLNWGRAERTGNLTAIKHFSYSQPIALYAIPAAVETLVVGSTEVSNRMTIIADPKQRILDFIHHEIYSTFPVINEYGRVGERDCRSILNALCSEKKIKRRIEKYAELDIEIFTISKQGAQGKEYKRFTGLSVIKMEHTLDLQRLRANGPWVDWQSEHWIYRKGQERWPVTPDARVIMNHGGDMLLAAIELELNIKNPSRYKSIIAKHLENIRCGRYSYVMYFAPTQQKSDTIEGIFNVIAMEKKIQLSKFFGFYKYPFSKI